MKALQNLSIAKKFTAGFAVVVAVVVAMCVTVFLSVSAIGEDGWESPVVFPGSAGSWTHEAAPPTPAAPGTPASKP